MPQPKDPIQWARDCLAKGNLPLAEIIARESLRMAPTHPDLLAILADIADRAGEHAWATTFRTRATAPRNAPAPQPDPWTPADTPDPADRYLLIRAWGYGFWADVDHVLTQLLLAELTGRTPAVYWGPNSLFTSPDHPNAWDAYFEPVSDADAAAIASARPVFPPKWADADPLGPDHNKFDGPDSRMAALYFLHREEPLAVADLHTGLTAIADWIRPGHRFAGQSPDAIYRTLVAERLRLRPAVAEHIDTAAQRLLPPGPKIAIHLRGGDKHIEDPNLAKTLDQALTLLDQALVARPDATVFALTDDANILAVLRTKLGDRLRTTDATRTDTRKGIHTQGAHQGHTLALEVLTDTYLAARCDAFIGIGTSNVSCMVRYLKQWGTGTCTLLGPDLHRLRNWKLHLREPPA